MKAIKLLFIHGPFSWPFADLKIAVQTKSAGADKKLENRPPKSSDSEVAEPADEETMMPEVLMGFELAKSGE